MRMHDPLVQDCSITFLMQIEGRSSTERRSLSWTISDQSPDERRLGKLFASSEVASLASLLVQFMGSHRLVSIAIVASRTAKYIIVKGLRPTDLRPPKITLQKPSFGIIIFKEMLLFAYFQCLVKCTVFVNIFRRYQRISHWCAVHNSHHLQLGYPAHSLTDLVDEETRCS